MSFLHPLPSKRRVSILFTDSFQLSGDISPPFYEWLCFFHLTVVHHHAKDPALLCAYYCVETEERCSWSDHVVPNSRWSFDLFWPVPFVSATYPTWNLLQQTWTMWTFLIVSHSKHECLSTKHLQSSGMCFKQSGGFIDIIPSLALFFFFF